MNRFCYRITKSGALKLCDGPDAIGNTAVCRRAVLYQDRASTDCLVWSRDNTKIRFGYGAAHSARKLGEYGAMARFVELSGIPMQSAIP